MPGALADDSPYDETPRVGRPRDPRVDEAVRQATLDLLIEEGYQATSIQAIARRADVSAPSIYRRWSSKAELIEAAVFPSDLVEPADVDGDLDTELTDYCRQILAYLAQPAVRAAVPGLLSEYQTDPHMWQRLGAGPRPAHVAAPGRPPRPADAGVVRELPREQRPDARAVGRHVVRGDARGAVR